MKFDHHRRSKPRFAALTSGTAILIVAQVFLLTEVKAQTSPTKTTVSKPTQAKPSAPLPAKATPSNGGSDGESKISITSFLDQVAKGNDGYRAAEMNRRAAKSYAAESEITLAPTLFANAVLASDAKPSPFSTFGLGYNRIETNTYSAGISKLFSTGIKTSFSYLAVDTAYVGIQPQYFEARPQIEATLPLWRNFWGRETMGNFEASRLAAEARSEAQNALAKSTLVEAEAAYWRLALARETLKVAKESVDRARAMFDWTGRRVRLALSDKSEHLQSTAQLKARELDYKVAEDDERSARLSFNSARGINSDKVSESLDVLNATLIAKWQMPSRTQTRPDIEASRLQAEAAEAGARAAVERAKPTFELFGLYAFNSPQRSTQTEAFSDSWKSDKPASQVGVRLNMPLDFGALNRVREGYSAEANAQRTLVSRKVFEQERDWSDVVARFQLAKEKIRLYEELEQSQKAKLDHERSRQKSGRSTVAQVILFEADYDQTQLARIRALAEILNLNAQMKLYGVAYDSKVEGVSNESL